MRCSSNPTATGELACSTCLAARHTDCHHRRHRWKRQRKLYHLALNSNASKAYRPIQEAEAKRLAWDFAEQPELFVKHIERFAASNVCAIAYGRRVDDVNVGFIQSIIERMQEVGRVNLPGKQWLDQ